MSLQGGTKTELQSVATKMRKGGIEAVQIVGGFGRVGRTRARKGPGSVLFIRVDFVFWWEFERIS
jgi:hypothetical protein